MTSTRSHGHEIAYDIHGQGPVVLLICGSLMDRFSWHKFGYVEQLAAEFTVLTMDPLGHGESDKSHDEADYVEGCLVDHTLAVLDAEDIEQASVWGFSRGGNIAASTCWRSPERVRTLVLGATPMVGGSSWSPDALAALDRGDWDACWATFPVPLPDDARARIARSNDPRAIAAAIRGGRSESFRWKSFASPALAYVGDGEDFVDTNRSTGAEIGLPVAVLPTGGHASTFADSETVLGLVRPFL